MLLEYSLGELENLYEKTLEIISPSNKKSNYKCARYKPLTYIKDKYLNEVLKAGGYFDDNKKQSYQQNSKIFMILLRE